MAEYSETIRDDADERSYLLKRQAAHRVLAERAADASLRAIHERLVQAYADRADAIVV